jgi:flagellar motor protein MotB
LEEQLRRTQAALAQANTEVGRLDLILGEHGEEFRRLEARLDALGRVEQEVRERNRIFEEVLARFQSLIDGGRLRVSIVRGRLVIQLSQDILFHSGSATLASDGIQTLTEVGTGVLLASGVPPANLSRRIWGVSARRLE